MLLDRTADGTRLRFPGVADFVLSTDCRHIDVRRWSGVPASTVRHTLIDHVVPSALAGQGDVVLHASGVGFSSGAALVLGPSGAGKSTLAASLAQRGWPVLCDDGARLVEENSQFAVAPSYPGLRLWPDGVAVLVGPDQTLGHVAHDSAKYRWVPDDRIAMPLGLACIFVMEDSDKVGPIEAVSAREAFTSALDHSYRLPGSGADLVRAHFNQIGRLVASCPFYRLRFPYDYSRLNEVSELIEHHVLSLRIDAPPASTATLEAGCDPVRDTSGLG
ncbi:MAG: hypothetical protein M3256_17975 [Actinomycetota bacterium]|nr:hypothetical protein [Actinomycetota bacterium]